MNLYVLATLLTLTQPSCNLSTAVPATPSVLSLSLSVPSQIVLTNSGGGGVPVFLKHPVRGARVTSSFGMRMHPISGYRRFHNGIDLAAREGTPVLAAADGWVISMRYEGASGYVVRLQHNAGYVTIYAHLNRFVCGLTGAVRRGQVIAYVGATGMATGNHLHYGVQRHGTYVDPLTLPFVHR